MNTDELTRLYRSIEIGDDSVRNVLDAMPSSAAEWRPAKFHPQRRQLFALTAAALVILIAGLVYAGVHSGNDRQAPTGHSSTSTAAPPEPRTMLPPEAPDALTGAVVSHGAPLSNASVNVSLWPTSAILSQEKKGQDVPLKALPTTQTNAHGAFVVRLSRADIVNRHYRDDDFINFEVDVTAGNHTAEWNGTFQIRRNSAAPIQMIFDFGSRTIQVDGHRSALPVS